MILRQSDQPPFDLGQVEVVAPQHHLLDVHPILAAVEHRLAKTARCSGPRMGTVTPAKGTRRTSFRIAAWIGS